MLNFKRNHLIPLTKLASSGLIAALLLASVAGYAAPSSYQRQANLSNFNWSGLYAGGYLGASHIHDSLDVSLIAQASPPGESLGVPASNTPTYVSGSSRSNTFIGGLQVGDNWMTNRWVYGWVSDAGSVHLRNTYVNNNISTALGGGLYSVQTSAHTDWLITGRGKLGYALPISRSLLVYATGGLGLTQVYVSTTTQGNSGYVANSSTRSFKLGSAIGAGVELPIASNFTLAGEYLYLHFGSASAHSVGAPAPVAVNSPPVAAINTASSSVLNTNLFKLQLNYKF